MISQPKVALQSNSKTWLDMLMVGLGIAGGGLVALIGLWLWLTYQTDPTHSLLAGLSTKFVALLPRPWQEFLGTEAHLMGLPLIGQTPAFWYMARAGGVVGYLLLWLSVMWGLFLSTKVVADLIPAPLAYGLHEFLSGGAILFTALHAIVLVGDRYIGFNIFHLLIPFSAPYQPVWTGLGSIGFYLSAVLTGSFYIRQRIGQKVWRILHYLTFLAYALGLVHGIMAGTDSSLGLIRLMYLGTGSSVLFLIYYRLLTLKIREAKSSRKS